MGDYKFFMNVLMESDIISDRPITSYVHMFEIEKDFKAGQYFKTIMHLACLIESNIYQLLLKKLPQPPKNYRAIEIKSIQNLPLGLVIEWIAGKPFPKKRISLVCYPSDWKSSLITEDERLTLHNLKKMRNDIAHVPYLTYDTNLKKDLVKNIIDELNPIHDQLVKAIIKYQQKKSKSV